MTAAAVSSLLLVSGMHDDMSNGADSPVGEDGAIVIVHQFRVRVLNLVDLIQHILRDGNLVGSVSDNGDVREGGGQSNFGAFRIDHQVDIRVPVCLHDRASSLEEVHVDVATHDDQFAAVLCKVGVKAHSERDVSKGAGRVDADLARVLPDLLYHEPRGILGGECGVRESLVESRSRYSVRVAGSWVVSLCLVREVLLRKCTEAS